MELAVLRVDIKSGQIYRTIATHLIIIYIIYKLKAVIVFCLSVTLQKKAIIETT